jgi:hypothetical protein
MDVPYLVRTSPLRSGCVLSSWYIKMALHKSEMIRTIRRRADAVLDKERGCEHKNTFFSKSTSFCGNRLYCENLMAKKFLQVVDSEIIGWSFESKWFEQLGL